MRFVQVELGLDAAQSSKKIAVLDTPGTMFSQSSLMICPAAFMVTQIMLVFVVYLNSLSLGEVYKWKREPCPSDVDALLHMFFRRTKTVLHLH